MAVYQITDLEIGYANKKIADQINLSLNTGELVCLLGQNGVGKSTLLRTLANLQEPLSGRLEISSSDIQQMDRRELAKKLGIITTEKIGMSNMTVRELVALGRYPYTNWIGKESDEDKAIIDDAIAKCKINYIEHSKLSAISDGQFQKAMVARVLAQDTDIILMDEPTAHLDVVNRVEMFRLLQEIKNETGKAILISTHELDLSIQFADQLWLMNFNFPIITGTPEDLCLQGDLEKIFFHEEFHLDRRTGQIKMKLEPSICFNIIGEEKAVYWVQRALERNGYGNAAEGKTIEVSSENDILVWSYDGQSGNYIQNLIETISNESN